MPNQFDHWQIDQELYLDIVAATRRHLSHWPATLAGYESIMATFEKAQPRPEQAAARLRHATRILAFAVMEGQYPKRPPPETPETPVPPPETPTA